MAGKQSQLEKAIQSIEDDIAVLQAALDRLKQQRKEKAPATRKPRAIREVSQAG